MRLQILSKRRRHAQFLAVRATRYRVLPALARPVLAKELVASQVRQAPSGTLTLGKGKYAGDENCQGVTLDAELAMDLLLDTRAKSHGSSRSTRFKQQFPQVFLAMAVNRDITT